MIGRLQPRLGAGIVTHGSGGRSSLLAPAGAVVLNVLLGLYLVSSGPQAAALVLVAVGVVPLVWIATMRPEWLVYTALVVTMLASVPTMFAATANKHLLGTGGTTIAPGDIFVLLAIGGAVVRALTRRGDAKPRRLRAIVLSWPFALLAAALLQGVVRGHDRYATSYVSQPVRIVAYAGIAFALTQVSRGDLLRGLTRVFYATIVISALQAVYYLGTGTSQTDTSNLSTGGTRVLALSTSMFLAAGLVLALVHLDLDPRGRWRRLHIAMAMLALVGILLSLGRTTFAAVGVLVPVLVVALQRLRRAVLAYAPIILAVGVLGGAFVAVAAPSTATTIAHRFTGNVGTDEAVVQRQHEYKAAMEGFSQSPVLGLGFGRPVSFVSVDGTVRTFSGDPENSYIYVLAGGGIVALTALLVLIGVFFLDCGRRFLRSAGEERALVVFGGSLAFILLVNAVSGPVLSNPPLMFLAWIGFLLPAVAARARP
jgi:O-antigen ligase